jgi:hypothetical protein
MRPNPNDFDTWEEYEFACERYQEALDDYANAYVEKRLNERYYEN